MGFSAFFGRSGGVTKRSCAYLFCCFCGVGCFVFPGVSSFSAEVRCTVQYVFFVLHPSVPSLSRFISTGRSFGFRKRFGG